MSNYTQNKAKAIYRDDTPTMTDQSAREGTDINVIVRNIALAGQFQGNGRQPRYGDFTQIPDNLHDAHQMIQDLQTTHAQLPPELRQFTPGQLATMSAEQLGNAMANAKTVKDRRAVLPANFKSMGDDAILELTPDQLTAIITPPQTAATPTAVNK